MRMRSLLVPLAAVVLGLAGCGGGTSPDAPAGEHEGRSDGTPLPTLSGTLTVFAAASLTDVFTEFGDELMEEHPSLEVRFNFAGSSALATQIVQGAPADVFASANPAQMTVVTEEELQAGEPEVFARNVLQIAVPAGNPAGVTGLRDFAREEPALAVCAPDVPCGVAAEQVFEVAGVTAVPDTLEEDVRAALTKVELGEVDAALVYASDVDSAGDAVEGIEFPEAGEAVNDYPICALGDAPNPEAAAAFVDLVLSEAGQRTLRDAGFREP
jgi:molybdate transport system substrate-binding protein